MTLPHLTRAHVIALAIVGVVVLGLAAIFGADGLSLLIEAYHSITTE